MPAREVQSPTPKPEQPFVIGAFRVFYKPVTMPDGLTYNYNPDPVIDLIHSLSQLERTMQSEDGEALTAALIEGQDLAVRLLREWNPDMEAWRAMNGDTNGKVEEDNRLQFPSAISMTAMELYQFMSLVAGGDSAAKQISDSLNAASELTANMAEDGDTEDAEPVPLRKPSSARSRGSAKKTAGGRTGGKASPGGSTASNSTKQAAA